MQISFFLIILRFNWQGNTISFNFLALPMLVSYCSWWCHTSQICLRWSLDSPWKLHILKTTWLKIPAQIVERGTCTAICLQLWLHYDQHKSDKELLSVWPTELHHRTCLGEVPIQRDTIPRCRNCLCCKIHRRQFVGNDVNSLSHSAFLFPHTCKFILLW